MVDGILNVLLLGIKEILKVYIEECRCREGTLDKMTKVNKVPALTMVHGGIGDALEKLYPFLHARQKCVRLDVPDFINTCMLDLKKEPVDLFPHLRTDQLAHLLRILACCGDVMHNRGCIGGIKSERLHDTVGIVYSVNCLRRA